MVDTDRQMISRKTEKQIHRYKKPSEIPCILDKECTTTLWVIINIKLRQKSEKKLSLNLGYERKECIL